VCPLIHCPVVVEPTGLNKTDKKRPDMCIHTPSGTLLVDVTIIHPTAKSYRRRVAKHGVEALGDKTDASKIKKYADMTAELDSEFHSVVLYTYGGFHSSAFKLINKLSDAVDEATCLMSRARFKQTLMERVAIAVQRGTADIMTQHTYRVKEVIQGRSLHRHLAQKKQVQWTPIRRVQSIANTISDAVMNNNTVTEPMTPVIGTATLEEEEEHEATITAQSELLLNDSTNRANTDTTQQTLVQQQAVDTDVNMSDVFTLLCDINKDTGQDRYMESDKDEESRDNTQGDDRRSTHCVFTTSDMNTGMGMNNEERSEI
jgi:hypothetical protein